MGSEPMVDVNPYGEPQPVPLLGWLRGACDRDGIGIERAVDNVGDWLTGLCDLLVRKGVLTTAEVLIAVGETYAVDAATPRKEDT